MDLVEFLRARLDEDERIAKAAVGRIDEQTSYIEVSIQQAEDHIDRFTPKRVLAEVDAKRRIVDECNWGGPDHADVHDAVLRRLALPYADHPEYRPEWKP